MTQDRHGPVVTSLARTMRLVVAAVRTLLLAACGGGGGGDPGVPQGNPDAVAEQYTECGPLVSEWERVDAEVTEQPERGQLLLALARRMDELH